ncbi:MAG TPA: SH3 domain-containing protein [Frateuria sp.]|uniref:C40 family peptidase n=1 Tax=Frateuria sp. TaxID=2211372 RepID=UPI002D7FC5F6|nr:SH3 domain-containing protein [Frateuria sp.]HET6804559.1 SH3 domain-containing protein [Frateuria sp.]
MRTLLPSALLALLLAVPSLHAREQASALPVPPSGVLGVGEAQLTPQFWIGLQPQPDKEILTRQQIEKQNATLFARDTSMHALRKLPARLSGAQVRGWIEGLADAPAKPLYDVHGKPVAAATVKALVDARALDAIPATQATRYGLVVHRAALRTFPTTLRVFSHPGDTDIDRFQETAEFPGTPVVIAHASRDGHWLFVVSPRYAAWTEATNIAEGSRDAVFGYADKTPYRIVTGAKVYTVFTREAPAVSQVELDMGTRVPVLTDLPPDQPVNGQTPYAAHVIELPVRKGDGSLAFSPALIQKNADTAADYLPLTPRNLITQAFKFLGERYGWGHAYDGRDCSGFVSDVYRSMGLQMPRNTSSQGVSPAFAKRTFSGDSSHAERLQAAQALQLGDLVYIPGHVMMSLGPWQGQPWVIHDVLGMSYRTADGATRHVKLNAVSVTPLLPMLYGKDSTFIDHMTSNVRMRP